MSVINQMLKDLQQRQGENQAETLNQGAVVNQHNNKNHNLLLVIVVSVVVTLIAVYIFELRDENLSYKNKTTYEQQHLNTLVKNQQNRVNHNEVSAISPINPPIEKKPLEPVLQVQQKQNTQFSHTNSVAFEATPLINDVPSETFEKHEQVLIIEPADEVVVEIPAVKVRSSMKISRQQMTPEMLAKQKMNRAKEAIANNEMARAEQLFEDVILIMPEQKDARKQLAALWFGRKSYRSALNLLSQGIHLDPRDSDLRMLKARIYIQQKQHLQAFQVLQSMPDVEQVTDIEYQSLLATEAQKSQQFDYAIQTYLRLAKQEVTIGRWWLGLAIAYDSNSQFELASHAYKKALEQQNISASAVKFVKSRIEELGE